MPAQQPFFIFGNPRSGTSLFRLMLNSHPHMVVPPECGFVEWLYDDFGHKDLSPAVYCDFISKLFDSRKFETWGMEKTALLSIIEDVRPESYQGLVREVYLAYARRNGKAVRVFGDKNNYYINKVEKVDGIFPGCKKLFIVRDGRDVACSYLELKGRDIDSDYRPNLPEKIEDIATEWKSSVDTMMHWVAKGALRIRYEDLVADPRKTLTDVCQFLGVEYSPEMLEFYKNNDEPDSFKGWKEKTFTPLAPGSISRYITDLTSAQRACFEAAAGDSLQTAGYAVSAESTC